MSDLSHLSRPAAIDVNAIRTRLRSLSDADLMTFGKQMRELVYPLTYGHHGKPSVTAFSIQLNEARAEWRRRNSPNATR